MNGKKRLVADEAPTDQDLGAPEADGSAPTPKGRRSFSRLRRELTDDELCSTGVQKILMDDVDRLENEKADFQQYVDKFHGADKENAVLTEKAKVKVASDIAFGSFLTIGAAAVGYSPSLNGIESAPSADTIILLGGIVLIIAGVASKVVLK